MEQKLKHTLQLYCDLRYKIHSYIQFEINIKLTNLYHSVIGEIEMIWQELITKKVWNHT